MPAGNCRARFRYLFRSTPQDLAQVLQVQPVGKRDKVDRKKRLATHCIDVGQGVRCSDSPKVIGIVNYGREKIGRRNDGFVIGQAIHGGVVRRGKTNQKLRIVFRLEDISDWLYNVRQVGRADLRGSTGAGRE